MCTSDTFTSVRCRRSFRAAILLFSLPSLLLSLARIAAGQPTAPTTAASAPAAEDSASTAAAGPAAGAAAEPSLPAIASQPPPSTPPASGTAAPAGAPSPPPPKQAKHDEYDGPPLLLGESKKKLKMGGYGGPTIAYTRMLHRDGVLIGGEGAVLVDHRLSFGGAGYAFSRSPDGPPAPDGTAREYFTGYGGVLIRYAVYSDFPVYASFGALIGGGAITLAPRDHDHDENSQGNIETRGFFVTQPDISLHVNATRWLRFGFIFGYRIATPVDHFAFQGSDLSGPVVGGGVQAGWF